MKKKAVTLHISTIIILTFLSNASFSSPSRSYNHIAEFKHWYENARIKDPRVQYGEIDKMINPKTVEMDDQSAEYFSDDTFDQTQSNVRYAAKIDIDDDGLDEIAILLIVGSGRFPKFIVLKKSSPNGNYKMVAHVEKNIEPVILSSQLLFIESERDFNSGRYSCYNILKFNKDWTFDSVQTIKKTFHYHLPYQMKKYISSDSLNKIANQNYSFLGIKDTPDEGFEINLKEYAINATMQWTTVGYYPNQVSVEIKKKTNVIKKFDSLWGFSLGTDNNTPYFLTVAMDDEHRESAIQNFRVTVYNMDTWQIITSKYITAVEHFENH